MEQVVFDKLRKIVYQGSGIHLKDEKKAMVSARLSKRLRVLNLADESAYLDYLLSGGIDDEIVELINAISTNVTHFYRESAHFDFTGQVVREWAKNGQKRFRFWSAACSTGEEPYTMAITISEALRGVGGDCDVRILATDISTEVIEYAKTGIYQAQQIKPVPADIRMRYFHPNKRQNPDFYEVKDAVKQQIVFRWLNLNEHPFPMKGPLDIIFCRNVMIYFNGTTKQRLIAEMLNLLKPGGYLIVAHAENLSGLKGNFEQVASAVYRRKK